MPDDGVGFVAQPLDMPLAFFEPLLLDVGVVERVVRAGELAGCMRPGLEEEALVEQGIEVSRDRTNRRAPA